VMDDIHNSLLNRNRQFLADNTFDGNSVSDIRDFFAADKKGFVRVPVSVLEDPELEAVKNEFKLSTRCMPFENNGEKVLIAKSY
jgi:prolyl-tRNA synthetase